MCLYVRDLDIHESRQLTRILKSTRTVTYMRRAQVVAFSAQGMRVQEIASRLYLHQEYVRELIRRFNSGSFAALRPRPRSGRPSKYSEEEISMILEVLDLASSRSGPGLPHLVVAQAGRLPGRAWNRQRDQPYDLGANSSGTGRLLSAHQDMERKQGSRFCL